MFDWISLGSLSPVVVGFLLIGLPTLLGTALFVGRMTIREETETLSRFAQPVLAIWLVVGYALFSFSLGSVLVGTVFSSWLTGLVFAAICLIAIPVASICAYGLLEDDRGRTYNQLKDRSLGRIVLEGVVITILVAVSFIALLTIAVVIGFGAVAGIEAIAGISVQISDTTSIAIFVGILIALVFIPIIANGGLD